MMAVYGIDVLDPSVSLRRIHVLSQRLPPGALPRVDEGSWTNEAHLLARLNDAIDLLTWVVMRVAGSKAKQPKPLPRPGSRGKPESRGQQMRWGELGGFLKAQGVTANGR
jgi:hypothetical protein